MDVEQGKSQNSPDPGETQEGEKSAGPSGHGKQVTGASGHQRLGKGGWGRCPGWPETGVLLGGQLLAQAEHGLWGFSKLKTNL